MWDPENDENVNEASVQRNSSSDTVKKEKSPSSDVGNDGGDGGGNDAAATKQKSGFTIPKIVTLVAAIFLLVALALNIWVTLLWWYWPWVITAPALVLVIVAVVFAFAIKGHDEAVLCCAGIGGVLALSALIWCAVELAWCHSYQGPLHTYDGEVLSVSELTKKTTEIELIQDPYLKAKTYSTYGKLCNGRCYDWAHRSAVRTMKIDCDRETEKWFRKKFFTAGQLQITRCDKSGYEGVDSYHFSPIFQSHRDIVDRNKINYHPSSKSLSSADSLREALGKFCEKFDDAKFIEKRRKCDDKIEEKFKPKCIKEQGGWKYEKGKDSDEIDKLEACRSGKPKTPVLDSTKWGQIGTGFKEDEELKADDFNQANCEDSGTGPGSRP